MLRFHRATSFVAVTVLLGLLSGCSTGPSEAEKAASDLQWMIDMEVEATAEGMTHLSAEDVIALSLYSLYTSDVAVEDILALGYTTDQLVRGVAVTQCYFDSLPVAIAVLGTIGISPTELVTACLANGASEEALASGGHFSAAEIAAAERPVAPGGSPAAAAPDLWVSALTALEAKDVCAWMRGLWSNVHQPIDGGLQSMATPDGSGALFLECRVGVRSASSGAMEVNVTFNPPSPNPALRDAKHCSNGTLVVQADYGTVDARGGFLMDDHGIYSYCVNNTEITVRSRGSDAVSFPVFLEEILDRFRGEGAGQLAQFVERFETPL
jgi:hypothetical protein